MQQEPRPKSESHGPNGFDGTLFLARDLRVEQEVTGRRLQGRRKFKFPRIRRLLDDGWKEGEWEWGSTKQQVHVHGSTTPHRDMD